MRKIAAALNVALLCFGLYVFSDARLDELKILVFAIMVVIVPAFTLFVLFAPND